MDNFNVIISLFVSLIAVVVSFFNLRISKKQIFTSAISQNRMDWIIKVRELMHSFITEYLSDNTDKNKLLSIKLHIDLYLNTIENNRHNKLSITMQKYVDNENLSSDEFMDVCKSVLKERWERIKLETAYSKKHLTRIKKRIEG